MVGSEPEIWANYNRQGGCNGALLCADSNNMASSLTGQINNYLKKDPDISSHLHTTTH